MQCNTFSSDPCEGKHPNRFRKKTSLGAKRRLRTVVLIPWLLMQERQELAERVMITRLTLYGRWIKVWILWLVIHGLPKFRYTSLLSCYLIILCAEMRSWRNIQWDIRRKLEADAREAPRDHHLAIRWDSYWWNRGLREMHNTSGNH